MRGEVGAGGEWGNIWKLFKYKCNKTKLGDHLSVYLQPLNLSTNLKNYGLSTAVTLMLNYFVLKFATT